MKIIVWKRADGSVATTDLTHMDAQTFEINKAMLVAAAPLQPAYAGLTYAGDIDPAERPAPRHEHYFDGFVWDDATKTVKADLVKCRELKLAKLRKERDAALKALDGAQLAVAGAKMKQNPTAKDIADAAKWDAIEAQKQTLRDMPVTIQPILDGAADLDALDIIKLS